METMCLPPMQMPKSNACEPFGVVATSARSVAGSPLNVNECRLVGACARSPRTEELRVVDSPGVQGNPVCSFGLAASTSTICTTLPPSACMPSA